MVNLSDDKILQTITDLSGVGYSLKEIAEVIEVEEWDLKNWLQDRRHPAYRAYMQGKNQLKYKMRMSLADLASNGSMPATLKIIELIQNQEHDERFD